MSDFSPVRRNIDAVAIGASAGGVEILSTLLSVLPATCPVSFFIVVHVPRERPSLLPGIYAAKCALPVREAEDKEPIQSGTVYFAPPDYHLLVDRGPALALSEDEPVHFSRPSIDVLFESAADVYGERLLGLILTGANADGAAGLVAIGRAGGRTVVQDPKSAAASRLPEAALAAAPVDYVLMPHDLRNLFASWGTKE
ncbi:MAG TPA: chemotaxis protein CheB [Steroidobacteraceae bacterium]|nr:chemotaxis protein CheB [Steroidobacteraceae bacterium]